MILLSFGSIFIKDASLSAEFVLLIRFLPRVKYSMYYFCFSIFVDNYFVDARGEQDRSYMVGTVVHIHIQLR